VTGLKDQNVLIIGGGPAGISAAIWCADIGLHSMLLERGDVLGGQMLWTHNPVMNYPGVEAQNGAELAERFATALQRPEVEVRTGAEVVSVDLAGRSVDLADGRSFRGGALVLATGVSRRKLGIPGEEEFAGRGILTSGASERKSVTGKKVVIIGGGDAALENSLILGEYAREVVVLHRRDAISAREEFVKASRERENISFVLNARPTAINGEDRVESVSITAGGGEQRIECDAVLIRIGVEPNTSLFGDQIDLDDRGYIITDRELRASVAGVWAVGDVTGPVAMTIANAVGHGSTAAKSIAASF
jgi:thioredoxin reductase (NADPH)